MKAIVSHDIDHLTVWEHLFRDMILPKFIVRAHIELLSGKISVREYFLRFGDFLRNQWNHIDELTDYNRSIGIPSSYFIGMANGLGLSYSREHAAFWIDHMKQRGCEVGLHGIAFQSEEAIHEEADAFRSRWGKEPFGVRMHYVRLENDTLQKLSGAGYLFDSTVSGFIPPYRVGAMWEIPFQIMDGWVIDGNKRWQIHSLEQAKEQTKRLVDSAHEKNLPYLGIDFHDRYFSKSFQTWMDWYQWITGYLSLQKIPFVNFGQAVSELEAANPR